ncbi:MAG: valine--tRNA ligase [archaeon]
MVETQDNKQYDYKESEAKLKKFWEEKKIYSAKPGKKAYYVDTPPPTVSGKMHLGHAFSYSQQDFVVRFRRMFNGNVVYPFGTDDNGLPTERLVEKLKGVKSKDMKREEFIKLCLETLKEITPKFIQDWKDIGVSCDYELRYSTIDDNSRKISQASFLDLCTRKLAYKKESPSMWCPECQTAIAQAELEDKELPSLFTTIKFSCEGKDLLIGTTRPELIPACVAVFVNPKDERYTHLIGKKTKTPLFELEVPIIADESAQIDKGTGVLMICSYGDKYDADAVKRHNLKAKIILNPNGIINFGDYNGMKIKEARKKILVNLKEAGLITEQKSIVHSVNVHDKCSTEVEYLATEQWFIRVLDNKKDWIELGNKINWYPEFMHKRYDAWVNGLEWDWNISRDRHFGVPIPVWECPKCKEIILAQNNELPIDPTNVEKICEKCNVIAIPEKKVLDTWATSSLTPQIASSLLGKEWRIPFSLRPQAQDIIRTWAFYTIVKSYFHEKTIPWENIMISGVVCVNGEKMAKSKGNGVEPQFVIENYGADAMRFWAAGSKLGEDLDYQEKDLLNGKKFITKLWNASKFVFMGLQDFDGKKPKKFERVDELFLDKLNSLVKLCTESFEVYEYSKVKASVEKFFWQSFCDNYLEIVKFRIYNSEGDKKKSAQYALYQSLLTILKLMAPIMPFITEEVYQEYFKKTEKDESIHVSEWPKFTKEVVSSELDVLYEILTAVRQEKSKAQKSMKAEIVLTIEKDKSAKIKDILEDLKAVTCAKEIKEGNFKVEFI